MSINVDNPTDFRDINTSEYVVQDGESLTGFLGRTVKICIAPGATVTLMGVNIPGGGEGTPSHAGITCLGDATIILGDGTENTVKGYYFMNPGIYVPEGKTLTIDGNGTLNAASNKSNKNTWAAGIGGGYGASNGNIVIKGGVINAIGGEYASGIGSSYNTNGGYIRIEGGRVNATGGRMCPGIGNGYLSNCCPVIITQAAIVTAVAGEESPRSIGKGLYSRSEESVTIGCTLDGEG